MASLCRGIDMQERDKPVILLERTVANTLTENLTDEDEKLQLIAAMIEEYSYEISFQNEKFVLFLAD